MRNPQIYVSGKRPIETLKIDASYGVDASVAPYLLFHSLFRQVDRRPSGHEWRHLHLQGLPDDAAQLWTRCQGDLVKAPARRSVIEPTTPTINNVFSIQWKTDTSCVWICHESHWNQEVAEAVSKNEANPFIACCHYYLQHHLSIFIGNDLTVLYSLHVAVYSH